MYKFPEAAAILQEEGLQLTKTPPYPDNVLERVHRKEYIRHIRDGTLSTYDVNRIGLPLHPRLYHRSCYGAWGTVAAVEAALEDGAAANLAGGTHHAFPDRGQGFCLFNDVAMAIEQARRRQPELYIMVIDTDAHQGNGTHAIYSGDSRVFTFSIHVERNFPSRKVPGDMDIGLPRYTGGDEYLDRLEAVLEPAFLQFEPDLVIWISGADVHENDRFGQLSLSMDAIQNRDRMVLECVLRWRVPLAVVYGGGYNADRHLTARLHANSVLNTRNTYRCFNAARLSSP